MTENSGVTEWAPVNDQYVILVAPIIACSQELLQSVMDAYLEREPDANRIGPDSLTIALSRALGLDIVVDEGWLNPAGIYEYRVNRGDGVGGEWDWP